MSQEDTGIFRPGIAIERANLANLFRQTPEMVCILAGPEHRFEFVNEAHIRALGFDATGKTVREAQPESVEVHGILDDVYRSGKTASLVEIPVTLTNRLRYFNLTYAARRDSNGDIDGIMILGSEVTDMVLARKVQENQRRWLESMLDRLPTPILFFDPASSRVTFENRSSLEMMGLDLTGKPTNERHGFGRVRVFRKGREVEAAELPSARAIRREIMRGEEYQLETPKGRYDVSISSDYVAAEFGLPETAIMLIQNVTPLKKTESALRRSEEQLSSALAVSKVGFYDWDIKNDRVTFSDQMLLDWGLEKTSTLSRALDRIHPDDRARVSSEIEKSMRDRTEYRTDYRVVHPDGRIVWMEVRGKIDYAETGEPIRFFGTALDVTERRRAEEALRTSEHWLRRLADSMPQVVWTARPDGILDYTNLRWTEYSGSTEPAKWLESVHAADVEYVVPAWLDSVATGKPYETEFRLRRHDGVYRWFLVRAVAMRDSSGEISQWLGTCTDIEDQKMAETALRAANLASESANASKSAFLANMSHEIRTPLGAILGFVGLMKNPKASAYNLASYISVIERNSGHLLRIIDDILDLSKVEAGQMQIERIEFSLPEVLADFASLMGFRAREKGIEFDVRASTDVPSRVVSDPTRIRQILANVVGNAIKFTDRGSVRLEVAFSGEVLRFVVTDTGLGISDEERENLFQPFTQADVSTTRKFGGTGLGLVLTRRLCEALGGEFDLVESAPGKGSRFEASIRVEIARGAEMMSPNAVRFEAAAVAESGGGNELAGLKILVVEDSPDNQTLFRITLEDAGATVTVAGDGETGAALALAERFDVVLMDIQMPRMDGHAAARLLRSKGYSGPLIALTAHAMKEERERCQRSGFTDFLAKPVTRENLLAPLRALKGPARPEILFVEDDADIRDSISELLELEGYSVTTRSTADSALVHLKSTAGPIVVLTDLTLPGMSGEDFVRSIVDRPDRERYRVLVLSGWDDLPRRAKALGADGSVRKPFDSDLLVKTIGRMAESFSRT